MAVHIEQWIHRRAYAVEAAAATAGVSVARSANVEQVVSHQQAHAETCFQCASYLGTQLKE